MTSKLSFEALSNCFNSLTEDEVLIINSAGEFTVRSNKGKHITLEVRCHTNETGEKYCVPLLVNKHNGEVNYE